MYLLCSPFNCTVIILLNQPVCKPKVGLLTRPFKLILTVFEVWSHKSVSLISLLILTLVSFFIAEENHSFISRWNILS